MSILPESVPPDAPWRQTNFSFKITSRKVSIAGVERHAHAYCPAWVDATNASRSSRSICPRAKAAPNEYPYASIGAGASHHLDGHHFNTVNGLSLTHVPYKGGAPAVLAVMGGEVASVFLDNVSLKPHVASGKLRLLASNSTERWRAGPQRHAGRPLCALKPGR